MDESKKSVDSFLIQQLSFTFSFQLWKKFPQEVLAEFEGVVFTEIKLRKKIQGFVGNFLILSEDHLVQFGHQLKLSPLTDPWELFGLCWNRDLGVVGSQKYSPEQGEPTRSHLMGLEDNPYKLS